MTDERDILDVEDEMIFLFCQDYGGLEEGMPIIREQFKRAGVDFRNPTLEGLKTVSENLLKVIEAFRGVESVKKLRSKFKVLLNSSD